MFDSQWLDIAIGVVFVWFLLALSVTAINEALARFFSLRSKQLWKALHQMLDGQTERGRDHELAEERVRIAHVAVATAEPDGSERKRQARRGSAAWPRRALC